MRRYAASSGYAPLIGLISGLDAQVSNAYILGLSDSDPYQLVLRKGKLGEGLDPTDASVLRVSDASYSSNTQWFHLKLDVIVNPHGDVVLSVFENDLNSNPVTSPVWVAVPGMDTFIDDSLGIITGSLPIVSGFYGFFGHYNAGLTGKVSLFDQITFSRQLNP